MTEPHPARESVEKLIAQDAVVSEFNFEEFRMTLEKSLESMERRARLVRRACWIASTLTVACLLAMLPLKMFRLLTEVAWVRVAWGACFWTALITAGVLLVLYRDKYRPALDRARTDLQISMIADLQRQIATLSERLEDRDH